MDLMILKIDGEDPQNYQKGEYFQISKENKTKIDNLISIIDNVGLKDVSEIELSENGAYVTYQNRVIIEISDISNAQYMLKMAANILDEYIGINENGRIFLDFSTKSVHFLPEKCQLKLLNCGNLKKTLGLNRIIYYKTLLDAVLIN